jgi:hypothetical protein
MGLDMYLYETRVVGFGLEPEAAEAIKKALDTEKNPTSVKFEVAYWRKANQVHRWFVENVQDGTDTGQTAYVSDDQLRELRNTAQEVLDDHKLAEDLLPTQEGFFFGDTGYDEFYFTDLEDTVKQLDVALEQKHELGEFNYYASW